MFGPNDETFSTLVFAWEYQAVTFSDQNLVSGSPANIMVSPIAESLINYPIKSTAYNVNTVGYLQLQGYNEDLGTDTDFYVLLTLHVMFLGS